VIEYNGDHGTEALTPQDYGFPEHPAKVDRRLWATQERFLRLYATSGKLQLSARSAGTSEDSVHLWDKFDKFGFQKRLQAAHQGYVEKLESQMDAYIDTSKHNTQILQIFRLKAEAPEKYRDDAKPQQTDAAQELLDRLTEMAARDIAKRKQLEEGATEGEFRDLGETNQG
jgi:hypothetical protein